MSQIIRLSPDEGDRRIADLTERPQWRLIAHVDMDSFYASAEVVRDGSLKDKPVIVGADPKEGKGRGVVVACNYVARKSGVRSAMPISQAWTLCPQAVYLYPDFRYYELLSNRVMEIIRSRSKKFEQVSIDEAFVDLSDSSSSTEEAKKWVSALKNELREKTGLTCSVGLAENKSAAKIATDVNKPDGITVVEPGRTAEFLKSLEIRRISGVGVKTELLLNNLGLKTIGDVQHADQQLLKSRLGKSGVWLWEVANGLEREEVQEHEIKSLSTERTLSEDTSDWTVIEQTMKELSSELAERANAAHLTFGRVGVKIRFRGFETHTRETTRKSLRNRPEILQREAMALLKEFSSSKKNVRLVGLKISELRYEALDQVPITTWLEK
jgi:DNA polymerase IV (DinB-like DNA polymerase)